MASRKRPAAAAAAATRPGPALKRPARAPQGHEGLRLKPRAPEVPLLALGASGIGCLYRDVPDEQAREMVEAALAGGFDYADTAPWYGAGLSELRLGRLLKDGQGITLSTKCGRVVKPVAEVDPQKDRVESHYTGHMVTEAYHADIPVADYTAEGINMSFRQSTLRLGRQKLDSLRLHDCEDEERWLEATRGGGVEAMLELRRQGLVAEIGLATGSPVYALRFLRGFPAGTFDSLMLAGCWNLLDQDGLEVLVECQRLGVRVFNVGVFASGLLWGGANYKYSAAPAEAKVRAARWKDLAERHSMSLPRAALCFALLPEVVARAAVGCASGAEVAGNLALCGRPAAPPELWREAKARGLLSESVPVP